MPQKRTTIVCERCMRNTTILWNSDFQNIRDYKACPLCGSKKISHLTMNNAKQDQPKIGGTL